MAADNPLLDDSPDGWERLIETLGPAAMLVCIERRLGPALVATVTAEDIWQETLLHVWRDGGSVEWRGPGAFRRWVLSVAENRIRNEADRAAAAKRGGPAPAESLDDARPPPVRSTTPSRVASFKEQAAAMRDALEKVPDELREVVRLRLFEEQPVADVAARTGLGESAVKHRFRKGAALYHARLRHLLAQTRSEHDRT